MLGYFRGKRVFLKHLAINKDYRFQLPYLCSIGDNTNYIDFLQRKTDTGFVSQSLTIDTEHNVSNHNHCSKIIKLLNVFKRSALKKLRNTVVVT